MECCAYDNGRWQSHCVKFLDVTQNWLENLAGIVLFHARVVHIVPPCTKDVMLSNYIMYALLSPMSTKRYQPMVINWITGTKLKPCEIQPEPHETWSPLPGRSHRGSTNTRVFKKSILFTGQYIWCMPLAPPAPFQECLPIVIDWTPTTGLILCQVYPGPAHELWPFSSGQEAQGSTRYTLSKGCLL